MCHYNLILHNLILIIHYNLILTYSTIKYKLKGWKQTIFCPSPYLSLGGPIRGDLKSLLACACWINVWMPMIYKVQFPNTMLICVNLRLTLCILDISSQLPRVICSRNHFLVVQCSWRENPCYSNQVECTFLKCNGGIILIMIQLDSDEGKCNVP